MLTPEIIDYLSQMEHRRWCIEKLANGWTHEITKDIRKRTNPLIIPWNELSESGKQKNIELIKAIPFLIEKSGFEMMRKST